MAICYAALAHLFMEREGEDAEADIDDSQVTLTMAECLQSPGPEHTVSRDDIFDSLFGVGLSLVCQMLHGSDDVLLSALLRFAL
eukprot:923232-Alexandrium_andersonii.AAC.1